MHGGDVAAREQLVDELREVPPERRAVAPHVELPRQALDHVDRRVAALRVVVVAGRHVDPERPHVRVAERVVLQHLALELVLVEAAGELVGPGLHGSGCYAEAGAGVTGNPLLSSSPRSIWAFTGACAMSPCGVAERPLLLNIA